MRLGIVGGGLAGVTLGAALTRKGIESPAQRHSLVAETLERSEGMKEAVNNDRRLARLSKICLELPEARREDHGSHASFLVRKKTFAYFLDDHHGDGIVSVCCKTALAGNAELVREDPYRFYLPLYIGPRGWVALRLDRDAIDWTEVADLARESYCLVAPKRLAALVAAG